MDYYVHNTSRAIANRVKRYEAASHRGLLQFLDGQRVVRGRPLVLSEADFIKYLGELKLARDAGQLEVRTADGRTVDLETGEALAGAPVPPLPVFLPDSAKNDPPSGIPMPIYPGGAVQSQPERAAEILPPPLQDEEEDGEVEHTEAGSGAKKGGGSKKGRR